MRGWLACCKLTGSLNWADCKAPYPALHPPAHGAPPITTACTGGSTNQHSLHLLACNGLSTERALLKGWAPLLWLR